MSIDTEPRPGPVHAPRILHVLECLGGARDLPSRTWLAVPAWGAWWAVLLLIIWIFSGQDSKFIYIDF